MSTIKGFFHDMSHIEYLADGLYAAHDGFQIVLATERLDGDIHWVALDDVTMDQFLKYIERLKES